MKTLKHAGQIYSRNIPLFVILTALAILPARAQFSPGSGMGGPAGPQLSGSLAKLFGDNAAFTAAMVVEVKDPQTGEMSIPGKIAFAEGKSRFEMDLTKMQGGKIPPEVAAQMKGMGMDSVVMVSRPDKKTTYMIYPGLKAYVEMALEDSSAASPSDFKMEKTELGKETVDGQPTVKNRVVLTDKTGKRQTATVWNATKLKDFPIKIEHTESGQPVILRFQEVKFAKPEARNFDPPAGFARHEDMMALLQEVFMKRMGGGQGFPKPQE
jgi:hypothetical protein